LGELLIVTNGSLAKLQPEGGGFLLAWLGTGQFDTLGAEIELTLKIKSAIIDKIFLIVQAP
jgi:hypothetical protein